MKICFITTEIFTHGYFGGYGKITRNIAGSLVKRGHDVYVIMPRVKGQEELEIVDGIKVYSYPVIPHIPASFSLPFSIPYFKKINPDIFHSCEINVTTWLAMILMPNKIHVINFQDPRTKEEEERILKLCNFPKARFRKVLVLGLLEKMFKWCANKADKTSAPARYLLDGLKKRYDLDKEPEFLTNPIEMPKIKIKKAKKPTVAYVGRFDWVKRPEIYFELAKKFPEVEFLALGKAWEKDRDDELRKKYSSVKNLKFLGFISDDAKKSEILAKTWIMINTSIHECLPQSFLEALAHKCAILSCQNPDNLVSEHGYYTEVVDNFETQKFEEGLKLLLKGNKWKKLGEKGERKMREVYETSKVIDKFEEIHKQLITCKKNKKFF